MEQYNSDTPLAELPVTKFDIFKQQFWNVNFQVSKMTYFCLAFIFLFVSQAFFGDTTDLFANMDETIRIFTYIVTIISLWILYGVIYLAVIKEKTTVNSIGLVKLRVLDFARGFAILMALFVIATILTYFMAQLGYVIPGEVEMFLPQELFGKLLWVVMSFTAGFCEEAVFRGYLMTRIRLLGKFNSWTVPVILSSLFFGIPHLYQGLAGVVVITAVGALFAVSYVRYKTIWPAVIAHFFLDFLNLFIPWFESLFERIMG